VVKAVWEAQGVTDDVIKKDMLVSALQDRALTWYIKHPSDNPNVGIKEVQATLTKEFSRSKSEAQSIIGFKEITMLLGETPWELDQRLKCMICEANMTMTDGQQRAWFVASLAPHLRNALSQQRITTQAEAVETAIRLHETSI